MLRSLCRYLSWTSWKQGVSRNIYNLWLLSMFFSCLQQLPLQKKRAHLLLVQSRNLSPFPLLHVVFVTLYALRPSAVLVLTAFVLFLSHLAWGCAPSSTGKALLGPGCLVEVCLFDFQHFFSLFSCFSVCCFHLYLYSLQFHRSTISNHSLQEGPDAFCAFWCRGGMEVTDDLVHLWGSPFLAF